MTLSNLLHDAKASVEVPTSLGSLEVDESPSVCPISFYPWLRSTAFTGMISELAEGNFDSNAVICFDRDDSGYKVFLKGGLKKMDAANDLRLVYMTDDEIKEAKKKGVRIAQITLATKKAIADAFYGGYMSGTAAAGHTPNVIILEKDA